MVLSLSQSGRLLTMQLRRLLVPPRPTWNLVSPASNSATSQDSCSGRDTQELLRIKVPAEMLHPC